MKIGILNYNTGNLKSVEAALNNFGINSIIINSKIDFDRVDILILPGVGSFNRAMSYIDEMDFRELILKFSKNKFILGICLGYQILFEESDESPGVKGLGLIEGSIKKIITKNKKLKIPHTGWNNIEIVKNGKLLDQVHSNELFYFVHSYYASIKDPRIITSNFYHGSKFCSSIENDNIYGMQFHPEKSGRQGLKIYENLINLI